MTSIELYVARRLAQLTIDILEEEEFYNEKGYSREHDVTYLRARAHELKMLCEHAIGDENLSNLAKTVYKKIVDLDEKE